MKKYILSLVIITSVNCINLQAQDINQLAEEKMGYIQKNEAVPAEILQNYIAEINKLVVDYDRTKDPVILNALVQILALESITDPSAIAYTDEVMESMVKNEAVYMQAIDSLPVDVREQMKPQVEGLIKSWRDGDG